MHIYIRWRDAISPETCYGRVSPPSPQSPIANCISRLYTPNCIQRGYILESIAHIPYGCWFGPLKDEKSNSLSLSASFLREEI